MKRWGPFTLGKGSFIRAKGMAHESGPDYRFNIHTRWFELEIRFVLPHLLHD
jgi:hypothetical protein